MYCGSDDCYLKLHSVGGAALPYFAGINTYQQKGHGFVPYVGCGVRRGHGIFSNLLKIAIPTVKTILKKSVKKIGPQVGRMALDTATDILSGKKVKTAVKSNLKKHKKEIMKTGMSMMLDTINKKGGGGAVLSRRRTKKKGTRRKNNSTKKRKGGGGVQKRRRKKQTKRQQNDSLTKVFKQYFKGK